MSDARAVGTAPLTPARRRLFLVVTLLIPALVLGGAELALRLARPQDDRSLFVPAVVGGGQYLVPNPRVGERYFAGTSSPPAPPAEFFASRKPANGFRLFVLGESTTAGFPFPHNGTFSRELRDALRDVLPHDSVEVINLGIAATNSVTLRDLAGEVADARPDAVLIYGGHNEYYGVLGAASAGGGGAAPVLVRLALTLERLRLVMALRRLIWRKPDAADSAPSFMEILGRDREVPLGGDAFARGEAQFADNLVATIGTLRRAGIVVFVGSPVSNVRDFPPFASSKNAAADSVFRRARMAWSAGDTAGARRDLPRARDLDVVRFRAPGRFVETVRRVAASTGAIYVPVEERFGSASAGLPGDSLFLEHVHPTRAGITILARAFFEALDSVAFLGRRAERDRLKTWEAYERGTTLTPFDERVAHHTVETLRTRWPFVSVTAQRDYRASYRPASLLDSLAFMVSRGGIRWEVAKLQVANDYERRALPDSAQSEYVGLVRDQPLAEFPRRMLARALVEGGRAAEGERVLRDALQLEPTSEGALALGRMILARKDIRAALPYLEQATQLDGSNTAALYQLSLAYGLARDIERARSTALTLARLDPQYPGLAGWMSAIGLSR